MGKGKINIIEKANDVTSINVPYNQKEAYAWLNTSRPFAILEEEIDETILDQFESTKLSDKDVVYFAKSSLTPRSRIKEYSEENNITLNKTSRVEYADAFVFNYEDVKDIKNDKFLEYYVVPYNQIPFKVSNNGNAEGLNKDSIIYVSAHTRYYPPNVIVELEKFPKIRAIKLDSTKKDFTYRTFKVFLTKPEAKIVYDQTILKDINVQNIDLNMYLSLRSTLQASGSENAVIGAGILGNCNPEDNKIPLVLLLAENWNRIKSHKQSNFTFRALIEYYTDYPFYNGWKYVLEKLLSDIKGQTLSDDHMKILELFLIQQIKKELATGWDGNGNQKTLQLDIESIKFKINN